MGLIKWIRCGNDCEHCPAGWSESSYTDCGTEYDGGCYIYGDEWPEPCRLPLPPFVRGFIARRQKYLNNHQWDNYGDFLCNEESGRDKIREVIEEELSNCSVCFKDDDGKLHECNKESYMYEMSWRIKSTYDEIIKAPRITIRRRWADAIKHTVKPPIDFVKSYIFK